MRLQLFNLAIVVCLIAGCGKTDVPESVSTPALESTPNVPSQSTTVEQILKEAPDVPLVPHEFKRWDIEFTVQAPQDSVIAENGGKLMLPEGSGFEINFGDHLADEKEWWSRGGIYKAKQFLVDTPDTLFTESTEAKDDRYHFDAVITTGNVDVIVRNTKKDDIGAVIDQKATCLLLLKCARTISMKNQAPDDPVKALENLRARVEQDEAGQVTGISFDSACTRSTLALLAKFPDLKSLNFSISSIRGKELAAFKELPKLEVLTFHRIFIEDSGLKAISGMTKLKTLKVDWGRVTAEGVAHLKGLTELTHLALDRNDLSTLGSEPLAGMTKLEQLSLCDCKVGDDVLKAAKNMPHLQSLKLEYTEVSDAGLANLYDLKNLTDIDLTNTKVTDEGVKQLQAALPSATIKSGK